MSKVKVRTKKDTRVICGKMVGSRSFVSIDSDKFKAFAETRMGKIIIDNCLEFAPDEKTLKVKESAEQVALRAERKADKERISTLEAENAELKNQIKDLEFAVNSNAKMQAPAPIKEDTELIPDDDEVKPSENFTFDPEQHTIEHRGRGKYFVMDVNDDKVYGPLTEEEKAEYISMIEG